MLVNEPNDLIEIENNVMPENSSPDNHISTNDHEDNEQPSSSSFPSAEFKTKEAKAIYKVLNSSSSLLERYDSAKASAKKLKTYASSHLQDMQAQLQILTLNKISVLRNDFNAWEKEYMANHDLRVPTEIVILQNKDILSIYRRILIGRKLMLKWNISFN